MDWRGFELHPETPEGGIELMRVFPAARSQGMREHVVAFAARFGIYDMRMPDRLPNTRRSLAVAEFAREQGRLSVFRDLAMQAHWVGCKDLESDKDLAELAFNSGLDPAAAMEAANSPEFLRRVDDLRGEACAMGIMGIPTFVVGNQRVTGCQPYEVLADATMKAGALPRGTDNLERL